VGSTLGEVLNEFYGRDYYGYPNFKKCYVRPSGHLIAVRYEDSEVDGLVEVEDVWEPVGPFEKECMQGCRFYDEWTGMCKLFNIPAGKACIHFSPPRKLHRREGEGVAVTKAA